MTLLRLNLLKCSRIAIEECEAAEHSIAKLKGFVRICLEGTFTPDDCAIALVHDVGKLRVHCVQGINGRGFVDKPVVRSLSAHMALPLFQVHL